jgi:hypothetical protein
MIVQDVSRVGNQSGRLGCAFRDGQFTRYVEVVQHVLTVTASDTVDGEPVILHQNWDLTTIPDFQPLEVSVTISGFDKHLIVTLVGFTVDTHDSRRVTIKCDLIVREPWETY